MNFKVARRKEGGFTLVEVTIAIGITAVALVSLMGMLPRGLKTLQKAGDKAVMGRIHQQILGELQLTPWESEEKDGRPPIDSFNGKIKYYDDQGIEIQDPTRGRESFRHVYTARINLPEPKDRLPSSIGSGSYRGARLPGDDKGGDHDRFLRLVVVEITNHVDDQFLKDPENNFDNLDYPGAVSTYRTFIAKMGRQYAAENE